VPAALLLHGYASRKEDMAESVGVALLPLGIASLSLGAYLSLAVAERDSAVRAVILAAGGDLPDFPLASLIRAVADPLQGVRALAGRPLLMVHGRRDNTILPAPASRLFEAASEPKELQWWDAGHRLPEAAVLRAAAWLDRQLRQSSRRVEM
jgi:fermentation-respiration switch protein FrsA (DUF1100 family)